MADLIERLTTPRRQLHRFGKMVDKSPPAIQREAAAEIASLRTSLSQEREAREKAERERDELRLVGTEKELRRERDDARASLAEAKRLLKPFADIGGGLGAAWLDHETHWSSIHDNIAVRDLRAAGRFLSQEPNHER
jgi:hypothetical protein